MNLKQISVIIIVKNAEQTLLECLNSLKDFDEIILLNNESSDNTLKIANEFKKDFANLYIYHNAFIGFGALKNLALSYAKNDWILSIDADEVLENECIKELKNLKLQEDNIIALSRKNLYKGEWIKACGWWPDYVLRIFNKNFTRFNDNLVHESLVLPSNAKKIYLKNGLKHYSYK
ncbi:glycosyltransferase family 2 protein, partial [Campylobacter jejuni]|nr:glycosyltransferase family 2 protein [Campylobacter jejuni]